MKNLRALEALTVPEELQEVNMIGTKPLDIAGMKKGERVTLTNGVTLERTFDQSDFQGGFVPYVRVMGPIGHKNYHSDLSPEGLRDWGII